MTYPFVFATPMIAQIAGNEIQMQGLASMIIQPAYGRWSRIYEGCAGLVVGPLSSVRW